MHWASQGVEMNHSLTPEAAAIEEERIRAAYRRRQRWSNRQSWMNPGQLFTVQDLERRWLHLLYKLGLSSLENKSILEIGCGSGYWLRAFIEWGVRPGNITGIDLLPDRVAAARNLCPPEVKIHCGNAANLAFPDKSFDLVFQSTVFTSIFDVELKRKIAAEMIRVVKRDGFIIWYDFYANNPWNPDVKGIRMHEIRSLYPQCQIRLRRMTLAPPLARLVAPYSWLTCYLMQEIPWLCTHYFGVIRCLEPHDDRGTRKLHRTQP
jgi:ubiquinone/menaquinone biosynthesis C-methylase UbiE